MVVLLMGVLSNEILSAAAIMNHLEEHPDPDRKFYISDVGWEDGKPPANWVRFENEIRTWMNDEGVTPAKYTMSGTTTVSPATINWNDRPFPFWPLQADQVIILTNNQYRRQISQRPKKLEWAKWYVEQNIPVYIMNAINELVEIKDVNDFSNIGRIIIAAKRDDPAAAESPYNPQGKPQNYNPFTPQQQPYDPDDSYSKYLKERRSPDDYYGPAGANA